MFLHDRVLGTTVRLSVGAGGQQFPGPSHSPAISANGQTLVFLTSGVNAPSTGGTVALDMRAFGDLDDGKTTTGTVPLPTQPEPPPARVDPPDSTSNDGEPDVSGDGLTTGHTEVPTPGHDIGSSIHVEGPEPPPMRGTAPVLAGLSPPVGPEGGNTVVDLEGANFRAGDSLRWNGVGLATTVVSSTVLRVTSPARGQAPVSVRVLVRRGGQTTNALSFTYQLVQSSPDITSLSSTSGSTAGGQAVTIQGNGIRRSVSPLRAPPGDAAVGDGHERNRDHAAGRRGRARTRSGDQSGWRGRRVRRAVYLQSGGALGWPGRGHAASRERLGGGRDGGHRYWVRTSGRVPPSRSAVSRQARHRC